MLLEDLSFDGEVLEVEPEFAHTDQNWPLAVVARMGSMVAVHASLPVVGELLDPVAEHSPAETLVLERSGLMAVDQRAVGYMVMDLWQLLAAERVERMTDCPAKATGRRRLLSRLALMVVGKDWMPLNSMETRLLELPTLWVAEVVESEFHEVGHPLEVPLAAGYQQPEVQTEMQLAAHSLECSFWRQRASSQAECRSSSSCL